MSRRQLPHRRKLEPQRHQRQKLFGQRNFCTMRNSHVASFNPFMLIGRPSRRFKCRSFRSRWRSEHTRIIAVMMAVAIPISILVPVPVSIPAVTIQTISVCVMSVAVSVPILFLRSNSRVIAHHHNRAHHARQNLRLPNRQRSIKRKSHPQRHALRVRLAARHQHSSARNIDTRAHFGFLAEGRRPAESRGQTELDAMMIAPVHSPPPYRSSTCITQTARTRCTIRHPAVLGQKFGIFRIASRTCAVYRLA